MKKLEFFILTIIAIVLIGGIFTACTAQTAKPASNKAEQPVQIYYTSLSELIESDDEIECFAFLYDTNPDSIKAHIEDYRMVYEDDIRNAGYKVDYIDNHIYYPVLFDKYGRMVKYSEIKDHKKHEWKLKKPRIIGIHKEKVVFHYEIEDDFREIDENKDREENRW